MIIAKLLQDFSFLKKGMYVKTDRIEKKGKQFIQVYTTNNTYIGEFENYDNLYNNYFERKNERTIFDLKPGDIYYTTFKNEVFKDSFSNCKACIDFAESGNMFLTKKEAEKELYKNKIIYNIKKYCYENDIELLGQKEINEIVESHIYTVINCELYFYYFYSDGKEIHLGKNHLEYSNSLFYFRTIDDVKKVYEEFLDELEFLFGL